MMTRIDTMNKIKLGIVEDSVLIQQLLVKLVSFDPEIEVIGVAADAFAAREMIKKTNPDVITLDIMMPHVDGITFLKNLMRLHPIPVVMVSALTEKNSPLALEALSLGAIDYISKPSQKEYENLSDYTLHLVKAIKNAAYSNVSSRLPAPNKLLSFDISDELLAKSSLLEKTIIGIGASLGGIEAIEQILIQFPKVMPGIVIAQHIKSEFSSAFAARINKICNLEVIEAKDGEKILPSHVYIAPGGRNLIVKKDLGNYICSLHGSVGASRIKPSVDVLFKSIADAAGSNSIGILLTGMGTDGVEGMKAIKNAKGATIAQSKESSTVWGMPGSAIRENVVDHIISLQSIPQKILSILDELAKK